MQCLPPWSSLVFLSPSLSPIWSGMLCPHLPALLPPACLPSGLRCCVCLRGLVSQGSLSPVLFPILSSSWSGMSCPCSGLVSKILCAICATVWCLRWCKCKYLFFEKTGLNSAYMLRATGGMGSGGGRLTFPECSSHARC